MEFNVKSGNAEKQRTGCVVVAVFEKRRLSPPAERLDAASKGMLGGLIRRGDLDGNLGQSLLLHNVPGTLADRVLVMGCGRERDMGDGPYFKVIGQAMTALQATGSSDAVSYLTDVPVKGRDTYWKVRQAVVRSREALYRFDRLKSDKTDRRRPLKRLTLSVPGRKELADGERAVEHGMALANGIDLAKDLANLPANICTPGYLAEQAGELAKEYPVLKVQVLEQKDMEALGMGALLAVARGSQEPPKFIILEYQGANGERPVALVGKGVTFDSGGISIKPAQYMDEMKYDMSGAATVLGVMRAVAELALPIDLVGLIPTTENLPSGTATRPGDVVTSFSGQTIEGPQHGCRGSSHPVRRAELRGALQSRRGHRHRHPDGRLRHRTRSARQRTVQQPGEPRQRAAQRRALHRRPGLGAAPVGRIPGAAQEQLCRHGQHWRPRGGSHHGGELSGAVHQEVPLGAPGHRRHGLEDG